MSKCIFFYEFVSKNYYPSIKSLQSAAISVVSAQSSSLLLYRIYYNDKMKKNKHTTAIKRYQDKILILIHHFIRLGIALACLLASGIRVVYIFSFVCVVLLCVFTFWIPCCNVRLDFCIKAMFDSSLLPAVCRRAYIRYMCLRIVVSNTFCFVFVLCTLCCRFLWIVHFWLPLRFIYWYYLVLCIIINTIL